MWASPRNEAFRIESTPPSLDQPTEYAGFVDGPPIEVPAGRYVIDVPGETYYTSDPVELRPGDRHVEVPPA